MKVSKEEVIKEILNDVDFQKEVTKAIKDNKREDRTTLTMYKSTMKKLRELSTSEGVTQMAYVTALINLIHDQSKNKS